MADDGARPRFSYIPGLDGIRGIWVVIGPLLYHAATDTVTGGILGIDLFFTLSSYLIISIALNEFEKTGRIDLKAYAGRRARRLLPALFVALGLLTVYLVLVVPPGEFARWTGAIFSTLTYSANWYEIFSDVSYVRALRLAARIDGGPAIDAFPLDAFGFGVPVPAGTHRVDLEWRRATPEEQR